MDFKSIVRRTHPDLQVMVIHVEDRSAILIRMGH